MKTNNDDYLKQELKENIKIIEKENYRTTHTWISVKDKLPESGQRVIFSCNKFFGEDYLSNKCQWFRITGFEIKSILGEVTYWMPLPEPPIKKNKMEEYK